jgi:hypothetical protein
VQEETEAKEVADRTVKKVGNKARRGGKSLLSARRRTLGDDTVVKRTKGLSKIIEVMKP